MERINVTKTFLPPSEEFNEYIKVIWDSNILSNQGVLLKKFEKSAERYLGIKNFHFVTNGTIAMQLALRTLDKARGEIITTPFTYVATTSAILWEHFKPVYVDIDPNTLCIDAKKIEAAITKKTKAIMPVHVFGNVADVQFINKIAKKHNLKVIYDAAHAFGVKYKGKSIFNYGDIVTCSFHCTKLFHTIEGGSVIVKDKTINNNVELTKRFGHDGDDHRRLGINAKASEFQAAMGLCNLKYIDEIIASRRKIVELYDSLINNKLKRPLFNKASDRNYAYYPVIFKSEQLLKKSLSRLRDKNIFPRRYFYPSLNTLPYVKGNSCPISEDVSSRIACLPLYPDLNEKIVKEISNTLNKI